MNNNYFIKVDNLIRSYQQGEMTIKALKSISCRVSPGDRIALVGPSGSGKSSLLHLMAGLDMATAGSISWPLLGEREELRPGKIGFISQTESLVSSFNVVENIAFPLLLLGKEYDEAQNVAVGLLKELELEDISEKVPGELSGGQIKRVEVARALAIKPQVILADEPTGQLDHRTAAVLMELILSKIKGTDTALVIATHDQEVAAYLNQSWHLNYGQLEVIE
jgi:ABC-type lipoprotein export system ATPase subunit